MNSPTAYRLNQLHQKLRFAENQLRRAANSNNPTAYGQHLFIRDSICARIHAINTAQGVNV